MSVVCEESLVERFTSKIETVVDNDTFYLPEKYVETMALFLAMIHESSDRDAILDWMRNVREEIDNEDDEI